MLDFTGKSFKMNIRVFESKTFKGEVNNDPLNRKQPGGFNCILFAS